MKNVFFEYQPVCDKFIDTIWKDSLFVFDTNVLLNMYRYSEDTSTLFIDSLKNISDRVWLPHQAGYEFNKKRLNVIIEQKNDFETFLKDVNGITFKVDNKNRNPFFSDDLTNDLEKINRKIETEVKAKIFKYESLMKSDIILDKINEIFSNKIGAQLTKEQLDEIFNEGKVRYKNKIPPGFCDVSKPEKDKYGDLIIWKQILNKSCLDNKNIIFITDDRKEDWWRIVSGKTISPRPELIREFFEVTKNKIHFYQPFQFIKYFNDYFNASLPERTIVEIENYQKAIENVKLVKIDLIIKGLTLDIDKFLENLSLNGYNVSQTSYIEDNIINVSIIIPNFDDLLRRLESKYISKLNSYNLELVDKDVGYLD